MACDGAACGPACGCGILGCLERLFTCGAGCGRVYWGEWAYDPPERCDPCNDYGEWEGPSCGPACGLFSGCGLLWSARFHDSCGQPSCDDCAGVCDDCAGVPDNGYGDEVFPSDALDPEWGEPMDESLEGVPEMPSVLQSEPTLGARKPASAGKTASGRKPASGRDPSSRLVRQSRTRVVH